MFPLAVLISLSAPVPTARPLPPAEITPGVYEYRDNSSRYTIVLFKNGDYSCVSSHSGGSWFGYWGWHSPSRTLNIHETYREGIWTEYKYKLDSTLSGRNIKFRRVR